jgi:DNA-binding CsgD family transcriptional regulator
MVDDLARHAAVAVNAVRLTLDLQESRARLVTAREEEPRRLRRDLHDGLGPSLAAMILKLGAVRATVSDPAAAGLLDQVRADAEAAITEIRRLVEGLRPPSLDEVAAYRIAMEAMANVIRNAQATRCLVTVVLGEALEPTIDDNGIGIGIGTAESAGMGLSSMRERAVELGGSLTAVGRVGGYLLKGAEEDEILRAIRAIAAGEAIFGPAIARRIVEHFSAGAAAQPIFPTLTARERQVLELIAAGKGNAAIAHQLGLTLKTVRNHVSHIFLKLQVPDRAAAIIKARDAGYGTRRDSPDPHMPMSRNSGPIPLRWLIMPATIPEPDFFSRYTGRCGCR